MSKLECIKKASVDTHKGTRMLLNLPRNLPYHFETKVLKSLEMVPRAGLEPARPILSNPRILSPKQYSFNSNISMIQAVFGKFMHQKGFTRISRRLLIDTFYSISFSYIKATTRQFFGGRYGKEVYRHR